MGLEHCLFLSDLLYRSRNSKAQKAISKLPSPPLSFALAAGVGLGLCSLTAVIIVAKHCADGRATVEFGLATSGIGTGMFVFPVLNE